jgi:hypothetical protein
MRVQQMLSPGCLVWGDPYEEAGLLDSCFDVFRRLRDDWPEEESFVHGLGPEDRAGRFTADPFPPPSALAEAYSRMLTTLLAEPARQSGLARWGLRSVRLSADHAHVLRWLYPRAKFVFLTRDPHDALRAYKAACRQRCSGSPTRGHSMSAPIACRSSIRPLTITCARSSFRIQRAGSCFSAGVTLGRGTASGRGWKAGSAPS